MLVVLPENESLFDDEIENYDFPPKNSKRLKKVMGFERHRVVTKESTCASDFCIHGLRYLFDTKRLSPDEIDAMIYVTETPDYFMPPTSNVIQGELGLGEDIVCLDINQGCAGFLVGLIQAFMLLDQEAIQKVVLLNADTLTRITSKKDRNAYPIVGDGASITVLENSATPNTIYANIKMNGESHRAIMIPAGGFRLPTSDETREMKVADEGNLRSLNHYHMDGITVFNFVQNMIPPLIDDLLDWAGRSKESIDYYMFHQPNQFMLEKLAHGMGVPVEKMPNDLVGIYGNNMSATIPTAIAHHLGDEMKEKQYSMCLSGFGVGLTRSSMLIDVGPLDFCEMIDFQES